MKSRRIIVVLLCLSTFPVVGSTGVGNGGDVLDRFLEATRTSLIDVTGYIKQGVALESLCECDADLPPDVYCQQLKGLTEDQAGFCREFIVSTASQMLKLNRQDPVTRFRLTERELFVNEPGGEKRPVSAITDLGPAGDILFNYDRVEQLSPMGILSLISHEFGHKVAWGPEQKFITDNEAIGPFDFPGGGRVLMDSVGAAIATYAANLGKIGRYFSLEDSYSCDIEILGHTFESKGRSPREFASQKGGYKTYRTGIGNSPRDFQCSITENLGASRLTVQFTIQEDRGCEPLQSGQQRWTAFKLLRESGEGLNLRRSVVSERRIEGFNPLCDDPSDKPVDLVYDNGEHKYRFIIIYNGSVGKTNGYVRDRD